MSRHFAHINRLQRHFTTHVLLYHSAYQHVPSDLVKGLHNVRPDVLHEELKWMKRHFEIAAVDDVFAHPKAGLCAVTFDDGYTSVLTEALPVLRDLGIPCTIYLNGCSLQKKPFWRDKVRYLMNHAMVEDFLHFYATETGRTDAMTVDNFYRVSKTDAVNSITIDGCIDRYFAMHHPDVRLQMHCVSDAAMLVKDPLVTYGNHTLHHYLLSSLSEEEQHAEIVDNQKLLDNFGLRSSSIFSIPFGDTTDFNETTLNILRESGYKGFLFSRNRINVLRKGATHVMGGLPCLERYMAPMSIDAFQKQLLGMWVRGVMRR